MKKEDVMDKILNSKDTTVGGGSASALIAAMACGLGGMVARLSSGKQLGLMDEQYHQIADRLDELALILCQGSIDDTAAFRQITNAFKLPKATDEEKSLRHKAINDAGIAAASAPLTNANYTIEIKNIFENLIGKHNPNAESDLLIANRLLNVALYGFALNIEANLPLIKEEETKQRFIQECNNLLIVANASQ